jgi:predicted esterase YcpF (UPF0227 family)
MALEHSPAGNRTTHLLYLHGFRSSPQSTKARMVAAHVARHYPDVHWWCPQLPPSPRDAVARVMQEVAQWPARGTAVVGSSLGGFYATCLAAATGCRAALLNPAVHPSRDLQRHLGVQTAWHDPAQRFEFTQAHVEELQTLERASAHALRYAPAQCFALIAQGDELLDWREMHGRYPGCTLRLLEGSDHAISDFADHLGALMDFLQLA